MNSKIAVAKRDIRTPVTVVSAGSKKLVRTSSTGTRVYPLADEVSLKIGARQHLVTVTPADRKWAFAQDGGGTAEIKGA